MKRLSGVILRPSLGSQAKDVVSFPRFRLLFGVEVVSYSR